LSEIAQANGIEIAYETVGEPDDPALLLIMGLGTQLLYWREEFCRMLAERGFHVIRFDNRDVGLSTKMEHAPAPDVGAALRGDTGTASYTLDDMADDTAGLLDALGISEAHVVGRSMGGMIAQTLAIRHRDRVRSLVSIMSTTGAPGVGQPRPEVVGPVLLARPPSEREEYLEDVVGKWRLIASPGYPADESELRELVAAAYDRSYYPIGTGRQFLAIVASGDRTEALRGLDVPTLVIHGADDPLVDASGGRATAEAIPGAELMLVPGMGHDLPRELWPRLVDAICDHALNAAGQKA
jgi:pimeloyl-ACP methyl ester carboxylesterase